MYWTLLLALFIVTGANAQSTVETEGDQVRLTAKAESGGVEKTSASVDTGVTKATVFASVESSGKPPVKPSPPPRPSLSPSPSPSPQPSFPIDFSTTESSLRTFIFQSNVEGAAKVLRSQRVISLGAGLTYPDELSPLVEPTEQRNRDPDVVAFKALAKSALDTCDARKLATAVVLSFRPDCTCSVLTSEESDELIEQFTMDFSNREELLEILNADANRELLPGGRRLQAAGASPVTSFVCSSCWPRKQCKKMFWC